MSIFDVDKGMNLKKQHSNCKHITKQPLLFRFVLFCDFWGVLWFLGVWFLWRFCCCFFNFCNHDALVLKQINLSSLSLPSAYTSLIPTNNRLKCGIKMYPGDHLTSHFQTSNFHMPNSNSQFIFSANCFLRLGRIIKTYQQFQWRTFRPRMKVSIIR